MVCKMRDCIYYDSVRCDDCIRSYKLSNYYRVRFGDLYEKETVNYWHRIRDILNRRRF